MDEYLKKFKKKKGEKPGHQRWSKGFVSKFLLAVIFFLSSIIFTNISDQNLLLYKEYVLTESLPFIKIKNWYEDLFGEVLPEEKSEVVFSEKLVYNEISDYKDGEVLEVANSSVISNITSGIVVFIGNKEDYGKTIIVQGVDGADIWYGNMNDVSVSLYDYVEVGNILGSILDNKFYLVIKKDNEFIKYEDYKN